MKSGEAFRQLYVMKRLATDFSVNITRVTPDLLSCHGLKLERALKL